MKKILILTFYYPPDLGAGSFRSRALVDAINNISHKGVIGIDIVTTMPNRYCEHLAQASATEIRGEVKITRIKLPPHKNGFIDQAKSFLTYYLAVKKATKNKKYDTVFATSSRLLTAYIGSKISKNQKCPLFLDIRDIFTDTMSSILNPCLKYLLLPFFSLIENQTFKQATFINFVSEAFHPYLLRKIPEKTKISFIPNGIDDCFYNVKYLKPKNRNSIKRIFYAGNIGEGQGLDKIIPQLAKETLGKCEFIIIGSGGKVNELKAACKSHANIHIYPPIPRNELQRHYQEADILFLHLNEHPAFKRVLPSKIFEYAVTQKPILAGVAGYSAQFLQKHIKGTFIFPPCNYSEGIKQLQKAVNSSQSYNRKRFCSAFKRSRLMSKLAYKLLSISN